MKSALHFEYSINLFLVSLTRIDLFLYPIVVILFPISRSLLVFYQFSSKVLANGKALRLEFIVAAVNLLDISRFFAVLITETRMFISTFLVDM